MANSAERLLRSKYVLPAIHAVLFLAMWGSYALSNWGLSEGFTGLLFAVLMIVDLPFSIVAFGYIFQGGRDADVAVIAWGVGCTVWWYLLGLVREALIRRKSRAEHATLKA